MAAVARLVALAVPALLAAPALAQESGRDVSHTSGYLWMWIAVAVAVVVALLVTMFRRDRTGGRPTPPARAP